MIIMKKTMCIFLFLCMAASLFASCGGGDVTADTQTPEPETTAETAAPETDIRDNIPAQDYGKLSFNILAAAEQWIQQYDTELSGDVVNNAIYNRNRKVEEKFNIELNYIVYNGYGAGVDTVKSAIAGAVMSGSYDYDLVIGGISYIAAQLFDNVLLDMNELDYFDFSQKWWFEGIIEEQKINDKIFLASGHYGINTMRGAIITFFNKTLIEDFSLDDMYALVNDGKWTRAKMDEMSKIVVSDIDGNSKFDNSDRYGVASTFDYMSMIVNSFDYHYVTRDAEGKISYTGFDEKLVSISEWLAYQKKENGYNISKTNLPDDRGKILDMFTQDRALFIYHRMDYCEDTAMREMEKYGIAPAPKYNEDQEKYLTAAPADVACMPLVIRDGKMSAVILDALNLESYLETTPAYYEVALKRKYTRDNDSVEMLDLIYDSLFCDFAYTISRYNDSITYKILSVKNLASWWEKNESKYSLTLESLIEGLN